MKLAEIAKECRRAWELTEVERRLERLEALQEAGQQSQTAMYGTLEQLVDLYDRLQQRLNSGDAQESEE